ncbi:membrane protein [Aliivibrio wodanis]|uniref:Membrane protein n=1 Tax=Aliivibrio wodanis TaxID=80852 RepID=A0A090I5P1_9GAMM|nr:membrane protein [Aliivibrio wodanis]
MKLFWWNLNNKEKSQRSFFLAPFCLLLLLNPSPEGFFILNKYIVCSFGILVFVCQGFYYKNKSKKEITKK